MTAMVLPGRYSRAVAAGRLSERHGSVLALTGNSITALGPDVLLGEVCEVVKASGGERLRAEVVSVAKDSVMLMPFGVVAGVGRGDRVIATGSGHRIPVGMGMLGRVVDAFGEPIDGGAPIARHELRDLAATCPNPLSRPPITKVMETGVRAIDTLLPLGQGQRVGIFSGSGIGKSTLLGMLARNVRADVNVVALIGERGREVREFIERHLGEAGMARTVVVAATSDQPALARYRAAYTATTIAEYFRDQGAQVLLTMDSVTRFAMARREIGLAAGEPPTARGYTPSVFAEIPALCERCGTAAKGAITALYTVLVEGDDHNEPVSDILRATLDGHIVLTRELAHSGHYPAIDILKSVSRLAGDVSSGAERKLAGDIVDLLSVLERNRSLVDLGVYQKGSNPKLDRALSLQDEFEAFLRQGKLEAVGRGAALAQAAALMAQVKT